MVEHYFNCPYCWQDVSMLLDTSIDHQDYIEDCEVCCNPIRVMVSFKAKELNDFQALSIEQ